MGRLPEEVAMLTQMVLGLVLLGHLSASWILPLVAFQDAARSIRK